MKFKGKTFSMLLSLIFVVSMGICVYSCSSDGYEFADQPSKLVSIGGLDNVNHRTVLLDSIAESDDFLDFIMSCNLFSDKMDEYISTLNKEEKAELINNANNDDYVQNLINHVDIGKELISMAMAKERLFKNTSFLQLNESEKSLLFDKYSAMQGWVSVKTRGEGGSGNACEEARKKAYSSAYSNFVRRLSLCDYLSQEDKFACQVGAKLNYEAEKTQADLEYKRCMEQ